MTELSHDERHRLARHEVLRSIARIILLIGKGIGSPIMRSVFGEQRISEIEDEIAIIKRYQHDL